MSARSKPAGNTLKTQHTKEAEIGRILIEGRNLLSKRVQGYLSSLLASVAAKKNSGEIGSNSQQ